MSTFTKSRLISCACFIGLGLTVTASTRGQVATSDAKLKEMSATMKMGADAEVLFK